MPLSDVLHRAESKSPSQGYVRFVLVAGSHEAAFSHSCSVGSRKSAPRGYDASHPRAGYLLYEGLGATLEGAIPASAAGAGFVDECVAHFKAVSPLNEWLASVLRR